MKLSKVLSLVLAIAMLLSMPTFAAFTDVAADASYAEAVTVLSALEIINGYGDGTFKPDGKITRAEYAAIICRAIGMEDAAKGGVANFTDVPADHWATGYIATAQNAKIVNGMGDGTFKPDGEVTYEQAVKMLVAALGYELKAQSMGGYPTGYMMIANQESITVGTTNTAGGASRGTVARLTYNALTVPMMDQTAWGSETKFEPIKTQSLLWTKLNAVKADVVIPEISLDKEAKDITLNPTKYDAIAVENTFSLNGTVKINGVDLTGLQGLQVTAIIDKADESEPKLVCIVPKSGKNNEIVVDPAMMADVNVGDGYVEYYKTNDDDKTTKIKVASDIVNATYKNLVSGTYASDVVVGGNEGDLAYKFVDRDNDGIYETVFVENVSIFVVGNVSTAANKIYRDSSASALCVPANAVANITLDTEDDKLSWNISDSDGNALELADIKAGDVIAVATSVDGSGNTYYDIVISNETVEGEIGETYDETSKVGNVTLKKFKIGDADYMMLRNPATLPVAPGDSIVAKVYGNKVVAYEVAEGVKNYGLIINTNLAQDFGDTYQIQILTQKGEIATLNLAEKVNGSATAVSYASAAALANDFPKGDMIAYAVNKAGEIKAYDVESAYLAATSYVENVMKDTDKIVTGTVQYKDSSEKLGSYYITDSTVIFTTETAKSGVTKSNVAVAAKDILAEDTDYNAAVLYDENKEAKVVVLIQAANQVNMNSYPLLVTKKATVNVEGDTRTKLFGYVNGEDAEYVLAEELAATTLNVGDIAMFSVNAAGEIKKVVKLVEKSGDDFVVLDNAIAGVADDAKAEAAGFKVTLKTTLDNVTDTASAISAAANVMSKGTAANLKGFGVAGKAYDISGKVFRVVNADNYAASFTTAGRNYTASVEDDRIIDYSVNSNAVAYKYNEVTGKYTVTTLLEAETDVNTFDSKNGDQIDNDDLVYAYNFDGETKLVFIIDVKGE